MTITYTLGPTSATEVAIIPDWDYEDGEVMNRVSMRSKTGKLFAYKWYDTKKIKFTVNYMDNSDAAIVNSWWDTQTKLIFFVNNDNTVNCTSVMLLGSAAPFREFHKPYVTKFKGVIELEEYL